MLSSKVVRPTLVFSSVVLLNGLSSFFIGGTSPIGLASLAFAALFCAPVLLWQSVQMGLHGRPTDVRRGDVMAYALVSIALFVLALGTAFLYLR
jgi:hypothetical protein